MNCEECGAKTTTKGELVMETYACDRIKSVCLNCCGCDDHAGEPWFTALTIHRHYTFQRHHSDEDLEICLTLHDLPEDTPEEESRLKAWEIVRSEVVRGGGWYLADVETQVCA